MSEGILINRTSGTSFISYALARVIAPSGSNVTLLSPRGTAKTITSDKAKPLESNTNFSVYYFNVGTAEFGSCTITGVDGNYTMTKTVPITTNVEYTIDLFHRCPSGYLEVEYIEMPIKAFLVTDINIPGAAKYDVEIEFYEVENHNSGRCIIASAGGGLIVANSATGNVWRDGYSSNNGTAGVAVVGTWVNWKMQRNAANTTDVAIINGGSVVDSNNYGDYNWGTGSIIFNSQYNLADGGYAYNKRRFRKCIITKREDHTEVINMVPCYRISDNAVGFFNTVNELFYTGTGAASITAGPAI